MGQVGSDFTVTNSASVIWDHQEKYRVSVARTSPPPRVGAGFFIHFELEVSSRRSVLGARLIVPPIEMLSGDPTGGIISACPPRYWSQSRDRARFKPIISRQERPERVGPTKAARRDRA